MTSSPKRVAIVIPGFSGGGIERSLLELAEGMISRGLMVDLIVGYDHGDLRSEVPRQANVFPTALGKWRPARKLSLMADPISFPLLFRDKMAALAPMDSMRRLQSMVEHFKTLKPDGIVAAEATYNVLAVWAKRIARLRSRVVLSEHIQISMHSKLQGPWGNPELYGMLRRAYRRADGIVAVSNGVADDMSDYARLRRNRITTIYNPVVGPKLDARAKEPVDHPKFAPGQPPVILGAGRLDRQKDFATLLRAFAELRATDPASLAKNDQGCGLSDSDSPDSCLVDSKLRLTGD
ncbi:MAG: glycosyltransferase [Pseudomonadota bacterium]